jgi:ketosteroid isomerase-like protein
MSASTIKVLYDAMGSVDLEAMTGAFSADVVAVEPSSLPYGGTTTSRDALFEKVFGYLLQRASFQLESSEVFGDGDRLAGHFTATLTAHGSGESMAMSQTELYEVTDGVISRVEVFQSEVPALNEFFTRNKPTS